MPKSNVWKRIAQTCRLTDLNWAHGSFNLVQILTLSRECCSLFAKPFWLDIALILKWNRTRNKCQSNSFTKPATQMPFFFLIKHITKMYSYLQVADNNSLLIWVHTEKHTGLNRRCQNFILVLSNPNIPELCKLTARCCQS